MKEDGAGGVGRDAVGVGTDAVSRLPGATLSCSSLGSGREVTATAGDGGAVAAGIGVTFLTRSGDNIDADAQTAKGSVTTPAMSSATGRRFVVDGLAVSLMSASRAR